MEENESNHQRCEIGNFRKIGLRVFSVIDGAAITIRTVTDDEMRRIPQL